VTKKEERSAKLVFAQYKYLRRTARNLELETISRTYVEEIKERRVVQANRPRPSIAEQLAATAAKPLGIRHSPWKGN
jgi:hypothetical protein